MMAWDTPFSRFVGVVMVLNPIRIHIRFPPTPFLLAHWASALDFGNPAGQGYRDIWILLVLLTQITEITQITDLTKKSKGRVKVQTMPDIPNTMKYKRRRALYRSIQTYSLKTPIVARSFHYPKKKNHFQTSLRQVQQSPCEHILPWIIHDERESTHNFNPTFNSKRY